MIRPSNSGMATFIALSSGVRPRREASHCSLLEEAVTAWMTGTSSMLRISEDQLPAPGSLPAAPPSAKLIVLRSTSTLGQPSETK